MNQMNDEAYEIAERFLNGRGCVILDPSQDQPGIEDDLSKWLDTFNTIVQASCKESGVSSNIRVFFSSDTMFNAGAIRIGKHDLIFLNIGILVNLRKLVNRL